MSSLKNTLFRTSASLCLLLSMSAISTLSSAQSSTALDNSAEKPRFIGFDEVIVTARKRSETTQEAPLSISAFTADMMEATGIRDMADIAKATSGFSLDEEFGRTSGVRPVIRGQATILGASGVSTFVDGILLNGSVLDYDLSDAERVEIVKGPQSALYGRNTYSGAINIITKSPSEEFSGDVKIEGGEFDRFELAGTMRGPINDDLSASLHGRYYTRGGTFTNAYDGSDVGQQESMAASLALYYEPSDKLSARARVRLSKLHDDQPRLFSTNPVDNNILPDDGGVYLGNGRYFEGEITNRAIRYDDERQLNEKGYEDLLAMQSSLSINYALSDDLNIEFINGFNADGGDSRYDFDHAPTSLTPFAVYIGPVFPFAFGPNPAPQSFAHAYVIDNPADFADVFKNTSSDHSHELRINHDGDKFRTILGGYYYQGSAKVENTRQAPTALTTLLSEGFAAQEARMTAQCAAHANDPARRCFSSFGFDAIFNFGSTLEQLTFSANRDLIEEHRRNLAIFGSFDLDISNDITLTAEGRYKSERIANDTTTRRAVYDYVGTQTAFNTSPLVTREATFNSFNPRLIAKYRASDTTNIYAVASRGDKPGGFNDINVATTGFGTYDEESVWAFEAGIKNSLMDNSMIFNLAAYHNTISDYQLTQAVTLATGGTDSAISNVGKVRVQGIEAEFLYRIPNLPVMVLNANYTLADSEILRGTDLNEGRHLDVADDRRLNCSLGLEDPNLACDADNVAYGSIEGRQLPRSPKHTFSVGLTYTRTLTDTLDFHLNTNASYESKKFVQVHNLAYVGANTLLNGSVGISNDLMSLTIWGRNLSNEDAVVSAQRFADTNQSFQRIFIGNPRTPREFGATFRRKF